MINHRMIDLSSSSKVVGIATFVGCRQIFLDERDRLASLCSVGLTGSLEISPWEQKGLMAGKTMFQKHAHDRHSDTSTQERAQERNR